MTRFGGQLYLALTPRARYQYVDALGQRFDLDLRHTDLREHRVHSFHFTLNPGKDSRHMSHNANFTSASFE